MTRGNQTPGRGRQRRLGLRARLGRVLVLLCAGMLTLTGCDFSVYSLPLPGGADLGDDPFSVTVEFRDVLDLVPQSAVKVNDVTVGKVDKVDLVGYHAEVTLLLRDSVKLPDDAVAEIRQTSLLGEKFVSLAPPPDGSGSGRMLSDGDLIGLDHSGRNPEVEEVLGALSLLLNGGGVAQLKTISTELNKAMEGREGNVRSVLDRLDEFMGQLDTNKDSIVRALESVNRLAASLREQKDTIAVALDELPGAIASVNRQRDDLVKMLQALSELSSVGTQVIRASKASTIDSLEALAPTLTKLAEAGDDLPKSLQVFLTYPFVDAVVGRDPAQARNLHMGDYTNLSVQLDLDLRGQGPTVPGPPLPGDVCDLDPTDTLCNPGNVLTPVQECLRSGDLSSRACQRLTTEQLRRLRAACQEDKYADNPICRVVNPLPDLGALEDLLNGDLGGPGGGGDGGSDGDSGGCTLIVLCRAVAGVGRQQPDAAGAPAAYDTDLGALLVWGMVER
jgi:phospholipid/cholesterol/gamma-HCH transport system substrate-binding protein